MQTNYNPESKQRKIQQNKTALVQSPLNDSRPGNEPTRAWMLELLGQYCTEIHTEESVFVLVASHR